jgi:hypothetical protein
MTNLDQPPVMTDCRKWTAGSNQGSSSSPAKQVGRLETVQEISYRVALAVGTEAIRAGLVSIGVDSLERAVAKKMWRPQYVPLKHVVD